jgi:hypothetical protein
LPASMWAMIPMLRVFSRVNLRGMEISLVSFSFFVRVPAWRSGQKNGPSPGPGRARGEARWLEGYVSRVSM